MPDNELIKEINRKIKELQNDLLQSNSLLTWSSSEQSHDTPDDILEKIRKNLTEAQRIGKIGSWEYDVASGLIYFSEQGQKIFGTRSPDGMVSLETWMSIIHPEDLKNTFNAFLKAAESGSLDINHRILINGETRHMHTCAEVFYNPAHKPVRVVGTIQDITDKVLAQDAIQKNEILLKIAGESAKIGGWIVELPSAKIIWSDEVAAIYEVPKDFIPTQHSVLVFYTPSDRLKVNSLFKECIVNGTSFDEVFHITTAKGNKIWLRLIGKAVKGADGTIIRLQGASQNITGEKQKELKIKKLNHRLTSTINSITEAFFVLDRDLNFKFINHAAERMLFKTHEELKNKNLWTEFPEAVNSAFYVNYNKALNENVTVKFIEYYQPLDLWAEVYCYPSGQGLTVIINNISEKQRLHQELIAAKDKAEMANRFKDAFIANISHEIRTPLNGILGLTSIIRDNYGQNPEPGDEVLFSGVENSGKRLIRTVDLILNYSRALARDLKIKKTAVSMDDILDNLIHTFKWEYHNAHVNLIYNKEEHGIYINADEYTVTEAVSNIIDNAFKYTDRGYVKVTLKKTDGFVYLIVEDTGIGISSENMEKIFEPYMQEDMGYGRSYEGIGLGLSIVKQYLQLNNASFNIESKKNAGTVFTVNFGAAVRSNLPVPQDNNTAADSTPAGKTILLVEDEAVNQLAVKAFLKDKFNIFIANSAQKARSFLAGNNVDLILMDISIKGDTDGLRLTTELKNTPDYRSIPVIVVTAHAFESDKQNAFKAGADDYLSKPYDNQVLLTKIHNLLS